MSLVIITFALAWFIEIGRESTIQPHQTDETSFIQQPSPTESREKP